MKGHGIVAVGIMTLGMATVLFADDPGPPDNGGSGTNAVAAANYISQPYPLNLLTTCIMTNSMGSLSSWADLDAAVSAGFDQMTNSMCVVYPPGIYSLPVDGGLFAFATNGEIAANIALFQSTTTMGVPFWKLGVVESTQLAARSWIFKP